MENSSPKNLRTLKNLNFENSALQNLPLDPIEHNHVREVYGAFFSRVKPTPIKNPQLIAYSPEALSLIDLDPEEAKKPEFVEYMAGNKVMPGSFPAAHCYCGHQFGNFAGQLGDGRAILLGEIVNEKKERWEIQLKGSGLTPFSRSADGRAVLRSSIREFLCSEAFHYLGIPTTRAGSLVTSETLVVRDIKYNGNPIKEKASVVLRMTPSFIRFGSFEVFKSEDEYTGRAGPSVGKPELLFSLLNYVIEYHYPEIWKAFEKPEDRYEEFFREIARRTAYLVALWQAYGWCHGVLNTDNMSITGVTIDYGPFAFLDAFNAGHISNGSDDGGRYSYENQPSICKWNVQKLAEALLPALPFAKSKAILDKFDELYKSYYLEKMRKKLGLFKELPEDADLVKSLFETLQKTGADFTNTFRGMTKVDFSSKVEASSDAALEYFISQSCSLRQLLLANRPQVPIQQLHMLIQMAQTQPQILAILGKDTDFLMREMKRTEQFEELKKLTNEDKEKQDRTHWTAWLELYRQRLQKEIEPGTDLTELQKKRVQLMNQHNPKFILRNYMAQKAIEKAENGDYAEVNRLLNLLKSPFAETNEFAIDTDDRLAPGWSCELCITCSS